MLFWRNAWGVDNSARLTTLAAKCGLQLKVVRSLNKSN